VTKWICENGFKITADKAKSMFNQRKRLGIELRNKLRIWINNKEIQMARYYRIFKHIKDVKAKATIKRRKKVAYT
jgi:hypothetical protein